MIPLPTHPIKLSFAISKEQEKDRTHFLLLLSEYTPLPFPQLSNMGKVFKCPTGRRKTQREEKGVTIMVRIEENSSKMLFKQGNFLIFSPIYCIQHCFICRPSDSTDCVGDFGIDSQTL
jgi:hypothetical protein